MTTIQYSDIKSPESILVFGLAGGLGNLLFQYLAGLALSERVGAPLYFVENDPPAHQSRLELLGISPKYISIPESVSSDIYREEISSDSDITKNYLPEPRLNLVSEPYFHYWEGFFETKPGSIMIGHWQSPKYFAPLKHRLREICNLEQICSKIENPLLEDIRNSNSVSVHIRRGDYLRNPSALEYHGLLQIEYYDRARQILERSINPDRYIVFSDEPKLARQLLSGWNDTVFISTNPQEFDLALMARCRHNIIANSSFSWWAAMLNDNSAKRVIAPKNWFSEQTLKDLSTKDLIPEEWLVI